MESNASAIEPDGEVVTRHTFAPGVALLTVDWPDGRHAATLVMEVDRDVSVDELRTLADSFDSFPAWLRARALKQEARS